MDLTFDEPPERPRKTALQKLQEDLDRQMAPFNRIQEMQDLVKRYSPTYPMEELLKQFEPHRQIKEMLERTAVPKHIQDIIDSTSIAAQAKRMLDQAFPKNASSVLAFDYEERRASTKLNRTISEAANQYEQFLKPFSQQEKWLDKLQRQAFGGLSVQEFAHQLEKSNPAFRAMEEAKKSMDRLWPNFRDIDFSQFEADDDEQREAIKAAQDITQAAATKADLQTAVSGIVAAIEAQQHPAVKMLLWIYFTKILEILINGAVGAVMGYYANGILAQSPQSEIKTVKEAARLAIGSPELLMEYRYVSAKVLVVHQNPRAHSPEVGRLTFGKPVKLVKKEKDFALVVWTDSESNAQIQGWVFARYLGKFN